MAYFEPAPRDALDSDAASFVYAEDVKLAFRGLKAAPASLRDELARALAPHLERAVRGGPLVLQAAEVVKEELLEDHPHLEQLLGDPTSAQLSLDAIADMVARHHVGDGEVGESQPRGAGFARHLANQAELTLFWWAVSDWKQAAEVGEINSLSELSTVDFSGVADALRQILADDSTAPRLVRWTLEAWARQIYADTEGTIMDLVQLRARQARAQERVDELLSSNPLPTAPKPVVQAGSKRRAPPISRGDREGAERTQGRRNPWVEDTWVYRPTRQDWTELPVLDLFFYRAKLARGESEQAARLRHIAERWGEKVTPQESEQLWASVAEMADASFKERYGKTRFEYGRDVVARASDGIHTLLVAAMDASTRPHWWPEESGVAEAILARGRALQQAYPQLSPDDFASGRPRQLPDDPLDRAILEFHDAHWELGYAVEREVYWATGKAEQRFGVFLVPLAKEPAEFYRLANEASVPVGVLEELGRGNAARPPTSESGLFATSEVARVNTSRLTIALMSSLLKVPDWAANAEPTPLVTLPRAYTDRWGQGECWVYLGDESGPGADNPAMAADESLVLDILPRLGLEHASLFLALNAAVTSCRRRGADHVELGQAELLRLTGLDRRSDLTKAQRLSRARDLLLDLARLRFWFRWADAVPHKERHFVGQGGGDPVFVIRHFFAADLFGEGVIQDLWAWVAPGPWARGVEDPDPDNWLHEAVLEIDGYHKPITKALAIWATFNRYRSRGGRSTSVRTILGEILPSKEVERILTDADTRRRFANQWDAALEDLDKIGIRPKFDPATYPPTLQPNRGGREGGPPARRQRGHVARLFDGRIAFETPTPNAKRRKAPRRGRGTGALSPAAEQIRRAIEGGGLGIRGTARALGCSEGLVRHWVNGRARPAGQWVKALHRIYPQLAAPDASEL